MTDAPVETTQPSPAAEPIVFQSLDPRIVGLWRIIAVFWAGLLLALTCLGALMLLLAGVPRALPLALLAAYALFAWYVVFRRPSRLYKSWGYRVDGKVLEVRSGLLVRTLKLMPLNRLQHVDLQRGLLERFYGLASLHFHTAGTLSNTIVLPGLAEAEAIRLRDSLVQKGGDDGV